MFPMLPISPIRRIRPILPIRPIPTASTRPPNKKPACAPTTLAPQAGSYLELLTSYS
jgi:hypothetical protein